MGWIAPGIMLSIYGPQRWVSWPYLRSTGSGSQLNINFYQHHHWTIASTHLISPPPPPHQKKRSKSCITKACGNVESVAHLHLDYILFWSARFIASVSTTRAIFQTEYCVTIPVPRLSWNIYISSAWTEINQYIFIRLFVIWFFFRTVYSTGPCHVKTFVLYLGELLLVKEYFEKDLMGKC